MRIPKRSPAIKTWISDILNATTVKGTDQTTDHLLINNTQCFRTNIIGVVIATRQDETPTRIQTIEVEDGTGKIKVVWFNQPYIAKMLPEGAFVKAEGKVSERKGELYLTNPEAKVVGEIPTAVGDSLFGEAAESFGFPIYIESRGITSKWFYHAIQKIFKSGILGGIAEKISADQNKQQTEGLKDPIPD